MIVWDLLLHYINYVTIKPYTCQSISIKGEGSDNSRLKVNNIFVSIFKEVYQELAGEKDYFRFEFENNIPFQEVLVVVQLLLLVQLLVHII